jgi:short-subunit dehydrogenase
VCLIQAATDNDPARVVIIGSIFGSRINDFETYAYGATKAAVYNLSNMLAFKLAPFKVSHVLCETFTKYETDDKEFQNKQQEENIRLCCGLINSLKYLISLF